MAVTIEKLNEIIEPAVTALNFELWGCEFASQGRHRLLRVYVERDEGVSIDDCARLSRQIGAVLDVADPMIGRYQLEVSSPGLARRLFTLPQFERFKGRKMKIRLRMPREDRRHITGMLLDVVGADMTIQLDDEQTWTVRFNDIDKANLIPDL